MIPNNIHPHQLHKNIHPINDPRIIPHSFPHYHKQNNNIAKNNNPEILTSPRIHINQYKVSVNQTKHEFLPIEKLTNRFIKNNTTEQINNVKSTIFTDNRNFKNHFQPGTLASMARFVPQNNVQNLINVNEKDKKQNFNDNHFNIKRFQKSPIILSKSPMPNSQKPNVYRSFIYPKVHQNNNQKKNEVKIQDIREKYQFQVNSNNNSKSQKQDSQKMFFNKYSAAQIQQNKINSKQTQRTNYTNYTKIQNLYVKTPSQKKLIVQPVNTLKKDLSSHLLTSNNTKSITKYPDFHQQLKKFKQDHFSTTTMDTPIKQKKFFKPVFFKPNKLTTHSDNKILQNNLKVPVYDLSDKKSQSKIKRTTSQMIMDESFSFDDDQIKSPIKEWTINDFQISDKLGKGAFGDVFIAREKVIGFICVIKKMSKKRIKQQQREQHVIRQLKIQLYLTHSHLASLYGFFDDKQHIYLVIQYLPDGNLSQIKKSRKSSQKQAANILYQLCQGLSYMHNLQIIHRDIKPQNIFVNQNFLKIGDFGCSVFTDKLRKTIVSCLQYSSPQQLNNQYYNQKIDVWGIGILAYELLTGKSPYHTQLIGKIRQNDQIDFSNLKYPQNSNISSIAKDFIGGLLNTNPLDRLNIYQALDHEFIQSNIQSSNKSTINNHIVQQIQHLLKN